MFPEVCVTLMSFTVDCSIYLNWTLIVTADFSVNLIGRTGFECELFRLPDLDTLILTNVSVEMGLTAADVTGRQGICTPPNHLIPPLV
jgi:hypothetical protein